MKTFVKNILAVCAIIFASAVPASAYDFEVDGIYFNIVSAGDRTCEVTSGEIEYSGDVVIPESVMYKNREVKIVGIGKKAFYHDSLTSVSFPNSVSYIGESAFEACSSLTNVSLSNSLIKIDNYAFEECGALMNISLPNSLVSIGINSFYRTGLKEISIPNSVVSFGSYAFSECFNLTTVKLPEKLETISQRLFYGCQNLSNVDIPKSVVMISWGAFAGTKLDYIVIPKAVTKILGEAFLSDDIKTVIFEYGDAFLEFHYDAIPSGSRNLTIGRPIRCNFEDNWVKIETAFENQNITENLTILNNYIFEPLYPYSMNPSWFKRLKTVTLGNDIDYPDSFADCDSLQMIILNNPRPIACPSFTGKQYIDLILYVPKGSLSAYQSADGWKNFWDIREGDGSEESEIERVKISSEKQEIGRYDIQGRNVSEDYKGFVIIRYSDGSVRKILNK